MASEKHDAEIERFVDELFTNGAGTEATRLVLVVDNPNPKVPYLDIGGLCKAAVVDRVTALVANVHKEITDED